MIDLKTFRKSNKLTQEEAAGYFGCTQAFISQIERGERPIPENFISKLEADELKNGSESVSPSFSADGFLEYSVPLLPISAQGGSLNEFFVSVKNSDCEQIISPIKGADFAITVAGDSMAPEYPNGSQVLIKKINEKAFIDWGKVFVLDTCNGAVIKVVVPSDREGCIRCVSVNPDPRFAPYDVCLTDIFGIYRVMLCMSIK